MKLLLVPLSLLFIIAFELGERSNSPNKTNSLRIQQTNKQPITNFLQLKWTSKVSNKNVNPIISSPYLITGDKSILSAKTGLKLSSPSKNLTIEDSLLVYDTESRLEVTNLKTNNPIIKRLRRRTRYVERKGIELINDSIKIEVDYDNNVNAFNIFNQKTLWSLKSDSRITDKPITHEGQVFVVNREEILVIEKDKGQIIKRFATEGQVLSSLTFYEDHIYLIVRNVGLVAIDLNKNQVDWKFGLENYSGYVNKIIVDKNSIYFADKNLYAINRSNGLLKWKIGLDQRIFIRRPDHLTMVGEFLVFYNFLHNESLLTVVNKDNGKVRFEGFNSSILGGNNDNSDGIAKEDLLLIKFKDELTNDNILIGTLDDKIYGLKVLK